MLANICIEYISLPFGTFAYHLTISHIAIHLLCISVLSLISMQCSTFLKIL